MFSLMQFVAGCCLWDLIAEHCNCVQSILKYLHIFLCKCAGMISVCMSGVTGVFATVPGSLFVVLNIRVLSV